ncbi:hypothetical protein T492DRAFT_843231 [Pavlovales sp. CCMP2436]|nr:hypothetical protein T492DRAFT_843231 [Pavlovales sp. CCMP2436]
MTSFEVCVTRRGAVSMRLGWGGSSSSSSSSPPPGMTRRPRLSRLRRAAKGCHAPSLCLPNSRPSSQPRLSRSIRYPRLHSGSAMCFAPIWPRATEQANWWAIVDMCLPRVPVTHSSHSKHLKALAEEPAASAPRVTAA